MVQRVSIQDAQRSLSEIVAIAGEGQGPVVLERDGKPLAVIVSVEDYERYVAEREAQFERLFSFAEHFPRLPDEEAESIAARELSAVRATRAKRPAPHQPPPDS
jgi:prevent-host-death family protein